jgi:hypothetical protein
MATAPAQIRLTEAKEATLREWCRQDTSEQRIVERSHDLAFPRRQDGQDHSGKIEHANTRPARVSKWRQRFAKDRLLALSDAPRSGMPHKYMAETEKRVLSLLDQPASRSTSSSTI